MSTPCERDLWALEARFPKCAICGKPASCLGKYETDDNPWQYACDTCCGHGNEDGRCVPLAEIGTLVTGLDAWARSLETAMGPP